MFAQSNTFPPSGNVGIGTTNPLFPLDVHGNIRCTDTIFTSGVVISNQVHADTAVAGTVQTVRSTVTGTSTVAGNLGIGTTNPNVKLDVVGDVKINGVSTFLDKIQVSKIVALPGDSVLRFGDSTLIISYSNNSIWGDQNNSFKGTGVGVGSYGRGIYSTALGYFANAFAPRSVAIGLNVRTIKIQLKMLSLVRVMVDPL